MFYSSNLLPSRNFARLRAIIKDCKAQIKAISIYQSLRVKIAKIPQKPITIIPTIVIAQALSAEVGPIKTRTNALKQQSNRKNNVLLRKAPGIIKIIPMAQHNKILLISQNNLFSKLVFNLFI